ncbi:nuclear transport factor 2 family protein [Blastomonas sp.]|uniref:nuclear transport factor 2 family protein n=1 Tax=Blastomonas sp. TaxID=1909299 RepID=UPI00391D0D3D
MNSDMEIEQSALAVLAAIAKGSVAAGSFTPDARWWWNGGMDFPVAEFDSLLGQLHAQMVKGIVIVPGLVIQQPGTVMIEATTESPLKDGRIYSNRYVFLFHFDGNRIREVREYSDSAHVLATFDLG